MARQIRKKSLSSKKTNVSCIMWVAGECNPFVVLYMSFWFANLERLGWE